MVFSIHRLACQSAPYEGKTLSAVHNWFTGTYNGRMVHDIFLAFWFLLPAALANASPIISAKISLLQWWDEPIDAGKQYKGRYIFGPHKTWRGLVVGMAVATIVLWLQVLLFRHFAWLQVATEGVNYVSLPVLLLGPLFGLGALGGDAIESFFKRRAGIASGKSWFLFDQLDYVVGAILVSLPFVTLRWQVYVWMVGLWFGAHLLVSYLGWLVGLKKSPI